jgi:phospholipid/cholesterol/gamma-HCH transport system substrate-binding protein
MRQHLVRDFAVGLAYLVLIAALVVVSVMVYNKDFTSSVDVTLSAGDVGPALQSGADVEVRGVVVGAVTSISSNGHGAQVHMSVDPGQAKNLPSNVTAEVLPKTLFGQRYVDLVIPATPSGTPLSNGDVIEPVSSAAPTQLQDVFAHLLPVLQAVRPAKLAEMLGAIAASLRNKGAELGQTIDLLSTYLKKFAPKVPAMVRDIRQFSKVAKTYTAAAPDLLAALNNFTTGSKTLAQQRGQFVDLLRTVTSASNRLGDFTSTNSQDLIDLSRDSLPGLQVLAHYSSEFPCLSRALVDFIPVMDSALGKGTNQPGLHVNLQVVPARAPYLAGQDNPSYNATGGPSCPQVSTAQDSSTALQANLAQGDGIGTQNSPQENEVIAELMAGSANTTPQQFPRWGSLLLGPALRGTTVSVR